MLEHSITLNVTTLRVLDLFIQAKDKALKILLLVIRHMGFKLLQKNRTRTIISKGSTKTEK